MISAILELNTEPAMPTVWGMRILRQVFTTSRPRKQLARIGVMQKSVARSASSASVNQLDPPRQLMVE